MLCSQSATVLQLQWEVPNEIFSMASLCPDNPIPTMGPEDLMACTVSNDPDTLTHKEAMNAPDENKFIESMSKELQGQLKLGLHQLTRRSRLPPMARVLPAVWCRTTTTYNVRGDQSLPKIATVRETLFVAMRFYQKKDYD